jgi:NAD(P)-dependent dehydrogenase (short-subunit alcohol dehydrogenase family)
VPTVLISGASSGIGRATALRLAGSGWDVMAGVRSPAAGEALTAEAGAPAGATPVATANSAAGSLTPLALDITDPAQVARAAEAVWERTGPAGLDALVNNAGTAVGGPLEMLALEDVRAQFEVNFFGHVAMTQALIPALRRAGGRLILVSSIGGLVTTPYMSPYCASKYALEAVGDSLRVELRRSHIQVALIEPGSIATPIWDKGNELLDGVDVPLELQQYYGHVPAAMAKAVADTAKRGIPPERVAQTIEDALSARRMRARYLVGMDAQAMVWLKRLLPDLVLDRVLRRALGV